MGFRAAASADQRSAFLALLDDVPSVGGGAGTGDQPQYGLRMGATQAVARRAWLARVRTGRCMRRCGNKACRGRWRPTGLASMPAPHGTGTMGCGSPGTPGLYPDGRRVNYTTGQTTMESIASPPPDLARVEQVVDPQFLSAGGTGTDRRSAAGRPVVPGDWPGAGPVGLDHHPGSGAERHGHRDLSAAYRPPARRRAAATTESVQTGRAWSAADVCGGTVTGPVVTGADQPDPPAPVSG